MEAAERTDSADDLSAASDDGELARSQPIKSKTKRGGVLGKLKGIFGSKKRRTRSHDSTKQLPPVSTDTSVPSLDPEGGSTSVNAMSVSVDSVFSPEDHNLPKTGIVSMKNTSASLEALMTGGIKGELERKLMNRRSLDDDGLPASPIGTPTAVDIITPPHYMGHDRIDRDSDGSLLSIGSSENEEDAFFKSPWKAASTSAIRRRHALSSDSEPEDGIDLDSVGRTENLSHGAAMHKRNVRPRHRPKTRRVSAAPAQMPSVAEKKTLEIAHTFLDEGKTPTVKLRTLDHSSQSPVTVRRTDSDRSYCSPAQQRKSDPTMTDAPTKSPKPVARSATTAASSHHHKAKLSTEEHQTQQNELLSVFQKLKPASEASTNVQVIAPEPSSSENQGVDSPPPPRPAKNVGFTAGQNTSSPPALERRSKPPTIQPRPKSMFPQNARSKTQEIDSVTVNEALSGLTYSKSFNAADEPSSRGKGSPMLRPKPSVSDTHSHTSTPDWIKLAKRKTWAVTDNEAELQESVTKSEAYPSKPVPTIRPNPAQAQQQSDSQNELLTRLNHAKVKSESLTRDSGLNISPPCEQTDNERPLLYASGPSSPTAKPTERLPDRGPSVTRRKSPQDSFGHDAFGSFYADKAKSPIEESSPSVGSSAKETIILPKPRPQVIRTTVTDDAKENELPTSAEPPWKAALKQRTGSLKAPPAGKNTLPSAAVQPTPAPRPAWKSATLKESSPPPSSTLTSNNTPTMTTSLIATSSNDGLDDILAAQVKTKTIEIPARRPNPMTVSETSAYSGELSPLQPNPSEEPKSFRDKLKMFQ